MGTVCDVQHAVVLFVPDERYPRYLETVGHSSASTKTGDAATNYMELLSASNIRFDVVCSSEINRELFFKGNSLQYSVALLAFPLNTLSDSKLSILQEVSRDYGMSLITSYDYVDRRSQDIFGIRNLGKKRVLFPLQVVIVQWPGCHGGKTVVRYGLTAGFPGIRKRGLRKLLVPDTVTKLIKNVRRLFISFLTSDLDDRVTVLATDHHGRPIAWSCPYGISRNYYFSLDSGIFLDKFNEMHRLVKDAVETNSGNGMASVDMESTMVLRMDDPGACSNDYMGTRGVLEEKEWESLGEFLSKEKTPLTVMYTPCWVDDGNGHGRLYIDAKPVKERIAGKLHDSYRVTYTSADRGSFTYDHSSEYRGLKRLAEKGLLDVQSHGLTHLDTDHPGWAQDPDKHRDPRWYHEYFHARSGKEVPVDQQRHSMESSSRKIESLFGARPIAMTPPGHRHGEETDKIAGDAGYALFSTDFTGIKKGARFIRNWKIPAIFLYLKDPSPFATRTGYPLVGVIHDFEVKNRGGIKKLEDILGGWRGCGITRFMPLRNLAACLCAEVQSTYRITESKLQVRITPPPDIVRPRNDGAPASCRIPVRIVLPKNMVATESPMELSDLESRVLDRHEANSLLAFTFESTFSNGTIRLDVPLRRNEIVA